MNKIKMSGIITSFLQAATYMFGIILFVVILKTGEAANSADKLTIILNNKSMVLTAYFIIYTLFGISLAIFASALYKVFKESDGFVSILIYSFGIIWAIPVVTTGIIYNIGITYAADIFISDPAKAENIFIILEIITEGTGGGNEIIGGIFTLLVSVANYKTRQFSSSITYMGVFVGLAGVSSTLPSIAAPATAIFGIGQIFWFVSVGFGFLKLKNFNRINNYGV